MTRKVKKKSPISVLDSNCSKSDGDRKAVAISSGARSFSSPTTFPLIVPRVPACVVAYTVLYKYSSYLQLPI